MYCNFIVFWMTNFLSEISFSFEGQILKLFKGTTGCLIVLVSVIVWFCFFFFLLLIFWLMWSSESFCDSQKFIFVYLFMLKLKLFSHYICMQEWIICFLWCCITVVILWIIFIGMKEVWKLYLTSVILKSSW